MELLQPRPEGRFSLFPFRSSLTKGISCDFFSCAYLDISVQRVPLPHCCGSTGFYPAGLPHSETIGSQLRDSSPMTIVVLYVLRRLKKPRHSLPALIYIYEWWYEMTLIKKLILSKIEKTCFDAHLRKWSLLKTFQCVGVFRFLHRKTFHTYYSLHFLRSEPTSLNLQGWFSNI